MRRKDREVTDANEIERIISLCECMRLGFNDRGQVYIVPLNFGFICENGVYIFYFHGAKEGRKIDIMKRNPYVGFEMDRNYRLNPTESACGYSAGFESIIGNGYVSIVEDTDEKKKGLESIMKQAVGEGDWNFKMIDAVCVFKLEVERLSCKVHK